MLIFQKKIFFLTSFLLLFSGCYKQNKTRKIINNVFEFVITGIECETCKKKIISEVDLIENIEQSDFHKLQDEKFLLKIILKNNVENADLNQIINIIQKNNFFVESVKGIFSGKIMKINSDFFFQLLGFKDLFKIRMNEKGKAELNIPIKIQGILKWNYNNNEYLLIQSI